MLPGTPSKGVWDDHHPRLGVPVSVCRRGQTTSLWHLHARPLPHRPQHRVRQTTFCYKFYFWNVKLTHTIRRRLYYTSMPGAGCIIQKVSHYFVVCPSSCPWYPPEVYSEYNDGTLMPQRSQHDSSHGNITSLSQIEKDAILVCYDGQWCSLMSCALVILHLNPLTPVFTLFSHRNNITLVVLSSSVRGQSFNGPFFYIACWKASCLPKHLETRSRGISP